MPQPYVSRRTGLKMTRRALLRALALTPAWLSARRRRSTYQAAYPRTY